MSQPCDQCGQPSQHPTCDRCLGYQAWASDSGVSRPETGQRHEQRVTEVREWLTELPDLYAMLPGFRMPGSAPKDPDQRSGKSNPAWRSVVNLDVLDLMDLRLKDGADETRTDYALDARAGARRQGVVNTLAAWSRLVDEERCAVDLESDLAEDPTVVSECAYLLLHLGWIAEQQWFDDELHPDVRKIRQDVRRAIGDRDRVTQRFVCPQCGAESMLVAGGFLACTLSDKHDVSVRDLGGQYRRRIPLPTKDICTEFGVSQEQLWQWKARRKIKPVNPDDRSHRWLPWDVFSLLNPDLRKAIDMRDAAEAS